MRDNTQAIEILRIVKKAAVEAVQATKPMAHTLGTVEQINPLSVRINQKLILSAEHLILTDAVRDFTVTVTNEDNVLHSHTRYTVHQALSVGETILLLRCDGGQKYIILGRTEAST